jgi:transposase
MAQVTVMTGPQRRRRWSDAERGEILEAVFAPGAVVADVARQFDVATSLIYKWRREHAAESQPAFLPAMVVGSPSRTEPPGGHGGAIVVHLADGGRVVIDAGAPATLVSATLKALRR